MRKHLSFLPFSIFFSLLVFWISFAQEEKLCICPIVPESQYDIALEQRIDDAIAYFQDLLTTETAMTEAANNVVTSAKSLSGAVNNFLCGKGQSTCSSYPPACFGLTPCGGLSGYEESVRSAAADLGNKIFSLASIKSNSFDPKLRSVRRSCFINTLNDRILLNNEPDVFSCEDMKQFKLKTDCAFSTLSFVDYISSIVPELNQPNSSLPDTPCGTIVIPVPEDPDTPLPDDGK